MNDVEAYKLAFSAAAFSRCHNKHIGAIIVKGGNLIGCGNNGPPDALPQCRTRWGNDPSLIEMEPDMDQCPRLSSNYKSGGNLDLCPAIHAEQAAIHSCYQSDRNPYGATMYVTCGVPCSRCLASIIDVGISEVVTSSMYFYDKVSEWMIKAGGLYVRLYVKYPEMEE